MIVKRDTVEDIRANIADALGIKDDENLMKRLEETEIDVSNKRLLPVLERNELTLYLCFSQPSTASRTRTVEIFSFVTKRTLVSMALAALKL